MQAEATGTIELGKYNESSISSPIFLIDEQELREPASFDGALIRSRTISGVSWWHATPSLAGIALAR